MTIGSRIRKLREDCAMSQTALADKIGVSKQTLYKYEKDIITNIPSPKVECLADALNTTPAYLMGWTDDSNDYEKDPEFQIPDEFLRMGFDAESYAKFKKAEAEDAQRLSSLPSNIRPAVKRRYKYLGEIACGEPIFADEQFETYIDLESDTNADFVLKAKGDSMINARINDGDMVFIKEQPDVADGEIAAVIIDDEATLKRVYKYDDHISLCSENPRYKPINIKADEGKNIRIIGKAVAAMIHIN